MISRKKRGGNRRYRRSRKAASVVERLDDDGDPLAAADAGGGQAVAQTLAAEFVEQSDDQAGAGSAKGMAEGDSAAVNVGLVANEAEFFFNREILRGEGLVDFDAIHLIEVQTDGLQRFPRRRYRADAHDAGIYAGDTPGDDAAEGLESAFLGGFFASHNDSCGAIHDAAGVAGGYHAVFAVRRRKFFEKLHGGFRA